MFICVTKLFSLRGRTFYNVRVEVFAAEILMIADTCSLFRLVQHDWTCFGSYTKWDRRSVSLCVDSFVNRWTCFKIQTFEFRVCDVILCLRSCFVGTSLCCAEMKASGPLLNDQEALICTLLSSLIIVGHRLLVKHSLRR